MPSGGSSGSTSTKVELPAWIESAGAANLGAAQNYVANTPYQAYDGQRVADRNADQNAAGDAIRGMQGQTGNLLAGLGGQAQQLASSSNPYTAQQITPQTLAGTDLQPYMNPFTGEVEANALKSLESSRQGAQSQLQDQFLSSKAFGGSRQALQSAVTDSLAAQKAGDLSSQLRQANFTQAQAAATGDITRNLQGQQYNQAANLQAGLANQQDLYNRQTTGLKMAGDLYGSAQKSNIADVGLLDTLGQGEQAQTQAGLDVNYQNFLEKQGYTKQQIEWMGQMIGSSPGSQTTTQTSTRPGGNAAVGALGGALSGAAAGSVVPVYGTAVGAVVGGVLGGLSSR
jgi:hypothetical protein